MLADRAAAEDALHDVFVQVASVLDRSPDRLVTFGYLATAVRNTCYSRLRRRRRSGEEAPLVEPASPEASEEERVMVDRALQALPAEQREVVYLKVFEGMTFQEIADRCSINANTAASRYRYATEALRRALAPGTSTC